MNTGIQDAHNLAWKIAAVMKGIAPSSLLSTYEMERRPVVLLSGFPFTIHVYLCWFKMDPRLIAVCYCQIAIFNTELSLKNYKDAMAVPSALGLDPTIANSGTQKSSLMPFFTIN